jgi:uncharacterized membrane protein YkvA (DUF1232 family)
MSDVEQRITIELNPRERRLYDQLRSRVVETPPGATSGLRDMLLLLPDLTVMLVRLLRDARVSRGSKFVALLGLGYVLSPIDLLPSLVFGPIGLVDDLLVVSATLSRLVNHVHPDVVRDAWPGKGDALAAIQRLAAWAEGVFGGRLRSALRAVLRIDPRAAR